MCMQMCYMWIESIGRVEQVQCVFPLSLQCGNGVKEEGESCDIEDFGKETCQSAQGTMCVTVHMAYV